jgi:hypothetical protein
MGVTHYIVRHYDLDPTPPHPTPPHLYSILIYTLTYPKNLFANTRFIMPWSVFAAQAQCFVHFGLPTRWGKLSNPPPFFMHRRSVSCLWGVFVNSAFPVRWVVFDAQAQYFVHSVLPT